MKKILPYLSSLILGLFFGYLLFQDSNYSISQVFAESLTATGFQLGVFNNEDSAVDLKNKYEGAFIMRDEDVYRVYYSILTNPKVVAKMASYLESQNINYYLKTITIKDSDLIKAINEYENTMIEGSETVLVSVNKLITSSYKGSGQ